jgi:hypothetical protein
MNISEIVSLSVVLVILNHGSINNRCHAVVIDERAPVYMRDPESLVVLGSVEAFYVNDYGMVDVPIPVYPNVNICYIDVLDNDCPRPPTVVTVIGFPGRQRHPSDMNT